jgi:hypothetical protein
MGKVCQGYTNFGREVLITTVFCTVALNLLGSSLWNWLHVTFPASVILKWLLDYWKFCGTSALRNAHYTRRLKFGHFSACVDIYCYVTGFISIYHVIYLYIFCILYRQIMLNPKPVYAPALCDVKPAWFIVRCSTVCVGVRKSRNTFVTLNWGFRNSGHTRSTLTWHAWKFIQ